jgi:hypothetical protein
VIAFSVEVVEVASRVLTKIAAARVPVTEGTLSHASGGLVCVWEIGVTVMVHGMAIGGVCLEEASVGGGSVLKEGASERVVKVGSGGII